MKKINQVLTGPYQGHMIVFTQGALWINTGLITLMRLDESVLRSAEPLTPPDETGEFNTLRVTYNDGTTSDLLMGPKLYAAALKSLASIVEEPEDEEPVIPSVLPYSSADASDSAEDTLSDGEAPSAAGDASPADGAEDHAEAPSPTSEPSAQPAAASTPAQPAKGTPAPTQGPKSAPKSTLRLVLTLLTVGIVAIIIFHLTGRL